MKGFGRSIVTIVEELCEPDPRLRGHPLNRFGKGNQYSLERYIAKFDLLARRRRTESTEVGLDQMSLLSGDPKRRVVPRWRDFQTTVSTGELDGSAALTLRAIDPVGFFEEKLTLWTQEPSPESASELISAVLVTGKREGAVEAAHMLIRSQEDLPRAALRVAEVLSREVDGIERSEAEHLDEEDDEAVLQLRIHALKGQVRRAPRNAIAWVDLARAYAMRGQASSAVRAMEMALRLAPENRFVLRAGARCFVHVDEPDRAHDVLRRRMVTRGRFRGCWRLRLL